MLPRLSPSVLLLAAAGAALAPAAKRAHPGPPPATRFAHADGPPPGHTGGFGEPTCWVCHDGEPLNAPAGALTVDGLPETYEPGRAYLLTVVLRHPSLRRAGFQLAARVAGGEYRGLQAGTLRPAGPGITVVWEARRGVAYAQHADPVVREAGEARWLVRWEAPASALGPVVVHLAANAANDDNSPIGDLIYTATAQSAPPVRGRRP